MANVFNMKTENAKDLKEAQSEWAQAANRRLEGMKAGSYNPIPFIKETAADVNLRIKEGAQTGNPYESLTNSGNPDTKARMLDFEHAERLAKDPSIKEAPRVNMSTNAD